jgi:hypothetical protein
MGLHIPVCLDALLGDRINFGRLPAFCLAGCLVQAPIPFFELVENLIDILPSCEFLPDLNPQFLHKLDECRTSLRGLGQTLVAIPPAGYISDSR